VTDTRSVARDEQHGAVVVDFNGEQAVDSGHGFAQGRRGETPLHGQQTSFAELGLEFTDGSLRQDLSVVDNGQPVAKFLGFFQVVGGVQNRASAGDDVPHHVEDVPPRLGIDSHGRLVQQDQLGVMNQTQGQVETPLHPARKILGGLLGPILEPNLFEQFIHPAFQMSPAHAKNPAPEGQVLPCRQLLVDRHFLRHHAEAPFDLARVLQDADALHVDFPGGRREQTTDHGDAGGLAGPVGAEKAEYLSFLDIEGDAVDGHQIAEFLA
jgi:hypothetical protein